MSNWNPPVDRNQTRSCRVCGRSFKPVHHMQHSHQECCPEHWHTWPVPGEAEAIRESMAHGFE